MSPRIPIPDNMFVSPRKEWTWEELKDSQGNMAIAGQQVMLEARREGEAQSRILMAAGWTFEIVSTSASEPWQWAWRRPPKRPGKPGRRFASTQQAINALKKEKGDS